VTRRRSSPRPAGTDAQASRPAGEPTPSTSDGRTGRRRRPHRRKSGGVAVSKPAAEPAGVPAEEEEGIDWFEWIKTIEDDEPEDASAPPPSASPPQKKSRSRRRRSNKPAGASVARPEPAVAAPSAKPPAVKPTKEAPPERAAAASKPKRNRTRRQPEEPPEPASAEVVETVPAVVRREGPFAAMGLSDVMLAALENAGYVEPTPIQAGLIPKAMAGTDLMGQAQTGTGKTAAFAIPILEGLASNKHRGPQALVLVPTRELAVQVRDEFVKLAHGRRTRIVALYGGKPIRPQTEKLQRGCEVVVGTPGRVLDHMSRSTLFLGDLRQVVLDEADRMLDIGFRPDIEKILRRCPESRQTLLLSATLPPPVLRLAQRYMREPEELNFSPKDIAVETIEQFYFTVDPERKFELLTRLIERENPTQAIIFCRTRRGTERIYQRLSKKAPSVACIHGDLPQEKRDRVMAQFRSGKLKLLVATDVVGRGIDVTGISHIINFDIPEFCDDYVHRVGRTGRMGREGVAYTLVTPEEGPQLTRIEMRINRLLVRDEIAGFAPRPAAPVAVVARDSDGIPETPPPPAPKPVFGRRTRRIRRAL